MQVAQAEETERTVVKAAILGASGYSGAELLRLLSNRGDVRVEKVVAATSAGLRVDAVYPAFAGKTDLQFEAFAAGSFGSYDVAFVALPSGEGMKVIPALLEEVPRVIDLGGDFRLPSEELYRQFYRHTHTAPHLLGEAVYGLPELYRSRIAGARLVANPGCYPTGAILGLLPALQHGVVAPEGMVINALSGVTGAGRSSSVEMSFAEVNENIRAYKIGSHQHIPEIQTILSGAAGTQVSLSFVPHLVPLNRGIYSTIHVPLSVHVNEEELIHLYEQTYREEPFVRLKRQIPQIKDVLFTNYCDIGLFIENRTHQLIIISVIDNLVKGAAGQAIQNMNIMFGFSETAGLL